MRNTKVLIRLSLFCLAIFLTIAISASTATAQDVASLYKAKCVMCHGADGKGATPAGKTTGVRSFAAPDVQKESDAELTKITEKGKAKMPAYENKLTAAQVKDLVAYVRDLGKAK